MKLSLTLVLPTGERRAFEFQREAVTVGAGTRNDIVVQSPGVSQRAMSVRATASGVAVEAAAGGLPSATKLLRADGSREALDKSSLLHKGDMVEFGDNSHRLIVGAFCVAPKLQITSIDGALLATDCVCDLNESVQNAALDFVCAAARTDGARAWAVELAAYVTRHADSAAAARVMLPAGADTPWERIEQHPEGPLPFHSLDCIPELQTAVAGSAWHVVAEGGAQLFYPVLQGERIEAIVAVDLGDSSAAADAVVSALREPLSGIWPIVSNYARRHAAGIRVARLEEENRYFHERQRRHYLYKELVTDSPAMRRLHRDMNRFVPSDTPVLLTGEAGTGKELLARAFHHLGPRARGMMIAVHCGDMSESDLDVELFGYAQPGEGGGVASRRGIFELANGGTVFLDEVHALGPELQQKLQRVIVEGELFRIGDSVARRIDVRIVAATHRDLLALSEHSSEHGGFRRDVAALLCRQQLFVPSLRDRREDIEPLVDIFVGQFTRRYRKSITGVDPETMAWLVKLRWPGNVRELLTVIERAVLQADDDATTLNRTDFELA